MAVTMGLDAGERLALAGAPRPTRETIVAGRSAPPDSVRAESSKPRQELISPISLGALPAGLLGLFILVTEALDVIHFDGTVDVTLQRGLVAVFEHDIDHA